MKPGKENGQIGLWEEEGGFPTDGSKRISLLFRNTIPEIHSAAFQS